MDIKQYCEISTALGNETRAKIVNLISQNSLCSCEILEHFNIAQPTLCAHIKCLKQADIIIEYPNGKWKKYELNHELLKEYVKFCEKLFANVCVCNVKEEKN